MYLKTFFPPGLGNETEPWGDEAIPGKDIKGFPWGTLKVPSGCTSLCKEYILSGKWIHSHQPLSNERYWKNDFSISNEDDFIISATLEMSYVFLALPLLGSGEIPCVWEIVGTEERIGGGGRGTWPGSFRAGEEGTVTAGEESGVVYFGGPSRLRLVLNMGVLKLRDEGVGCSLMGVALSVGWDIPAL